MQSHTAHVTRIMWKQPESPIKVLDFFGTEQLHWNEWVNMFDAALCSSASKVHFAQLNENKTFNSILTWQIPLKVTQWTLKCSNTCTQTGTIADSGGAPGNWKQSWPTAMGNLFIYLSVKLWHAVLTSPHLCKTSLKRRGRPPNHLFQRVPFPFRQPLVIFSPSHHLLVLRQSSIPPPALPLHKDSPCQFVLS